MHRIYICIRNDSSLVEFNATADFMMVGQWLVDVVVFLNTDYDE